MTIRKLLKTLSSSSWSLSGRKLLRKKEEDDHNAGGVASSRQVDPNLAKRSEFVGLRINQYEVYGEIGKGNQATVLVSRDVNTKEQFALRIIQGIQLRHVHNPGGTKSSRRLSMQNRTKISALRMELAVLRRVQHPMVTRFVEVFDLQAFDEQIVGIAIAMEYVEGKELVSDEMLSKLNESYWVQGNKERSLFPERLCCKYYVQILAGLEYLHHNGIIHGDIKPANVLIHPKSDNIKLIDFGVSTLCNDDDDNDGLVYSPSSKNSSFRENMMQARFKCHGGFGRGTVAFFSPESVKVDSKSLYCGKTADIWAAGLILYILTYGHLPFRGANDREGILAILQDDTGELEFCPTRMFTSRSKRDTRDFIQRLLVKDPDHRLKDICEIMQERWVSGALPSYLKTNKGLDKKASILDQLTEEEINEFESPITFTQSWEVMNRVARDHWGKLEEFSRVCTDGAKRISISGFEKSRDLMHDGLDSLERTGEQMYEIGHNAIELIADASYQMSRTFTGEPKGTNSRRLIGHTNSLCIPYENPLFYEVGHEPNNDRDRRTSDLGQQPSTIYEEY